jgi:hypothetical protein
MSIADLARLASPKTSCRTGISLQAVRNSCSILKAKVVATGSMSSFSCSLTTDEYYCRAKLTHNRALSKAGRTT